LDLARDLARDRDLDRALTSSWSDVAAQPELHVPILDLTCDLLDLKPRTQWREALRVRSLPRVPELITWVNPTVWEQTLRAFRNANPEVSDCRHAASQLLLDTWLYIFGCHDSPGESPFVELAERTRHYPSVYLRVAHCLRALAYDDEARAADLAAMVNSDDPEYRQLFRDAFWRD
jgi:hypothetical protein